MQVLKQDFWQFFYTYILSRHKTEMWLWNGIEEVAVKQNEVQFEGHFPREAEEE